MIRLVGVYKRFDDLIVLEGVDFEVQKGETIALLPARYPGSETDSNDAVRLSRTTEWRDLGSDIHVGAGQRVLTTDSDEVGLLEVRKIELGIPAE